jgi:hypothetical protein
MKKLTVFLAAVFVLGTWGPAAGDEVAILQELEKLKQRIDELEAKLEQQEAKEVEYEEAKAEVKDIKDVIMERLGTLSIHGGLVGYYQGMTEPEIGGQDFDNPDGVGYVADVEFSFEPLKNGEFYMRVHAGEGDGADRDLEPDGGLFADLNTINDDNPDGEFVDVLEAYYTHSFLDEMLFVSVGKTEQVVFIDDNAYANDENAQFVGKPFVNDPVLDSEDEYAPLLAVGFSPIENLSFVGLVQSSSHAGKKDKYSDIFTQPFVAGQVTFSPTIGELEGNYRLYGWGATYDHPDLTDANDMDRGWGLGVSLDQQITPDIGLFARAGYHNGDVYAVDWFWSLGANFTGLIPWRANDELGFGVAGLMANDDLDDAVIDTGLLLGDDNDGTEYHFEAYYRIALAEFFAITPDLQFVLDPLGDSDNDNVFTGMIKTELSF